MCVCVCDFLQVTKSAETEDSQGSWCDMRRTNWNKLACDLFSFYDLTNLLITTLPGKVPVKCCPVVSSAAEIARHAPVESCSHVLSKDVQRPIGGLEV